MMTRPLLILIAAIAVLAATLAGLAWTREEPVAVRVAAQPTLLPTDVDASGWKIFRHGIYPYEIKYPEYAHVGLYMSWDPRTGRGPDGKRIGISFLRDGQLVELFINGAYGEKEGVEITDDFNLKEYLIQRYLANVRQDIQTEEAVFVPVRAANWTGYQAQYVKPSYRENRDGQPVPYTVTQIYVVHKKRLYEIIYDPAIADETNILATLTFLD